MAVKRQRRPSLMALAVLACLAVFAGEALALQGTLVTPITFVGPVTGDTIRFSMYGLRGRVPFRQVVGTQVGSNQSFHALLLGHALVSEYLETGCPHTLNCVMAAGGPDSWSFIAGAFGKD